MHDRGSKAPDAKPSGGQWEKSGRGAALSRQPAAANAANRLLQLQQGIGNRAVVQLLADAHPFLGSAGPNAGRPVQMAEPPIQRRVKPYETTFADTTVIEEYKDKIGQLVEFINKRVLQARKDAVAWQAFAAENSNKHLKLWFQSAHSFVQNPEGEPSMIHARFGYAIETLACNGLAGTHGGLKIDLQVASGHTRPDIVVSDGVTELAWIDITSEKSKEHILGKDGSGWRRRPFVYEVLYDQLDLKELLASTNDHFYNEYGKFAAEEHQIEYDATEEVRTGARNEFIKFRDSNNWETGIGNKTNKKAQTRDFLFTLTGSEDMYVEDHRENLKLTKGALHYFGLNSGPFGFKSGEGKESNSVGKEFVRRMAQPEIDQRKNTLASSKNMELAIFFYPYSNSFPAAREFCDQADMITPDRELLKTGMALKAGIMDYYGMDQLFQFARTMLADEVRVKKLLENAKGLLAGFPAELDFGKIMGWRSQVRQCYQHAELLRKIQPIQKQFIEYAAQKYKDFFARPREVNEILQEFDRDSPREAVIEAAKQWMAKNP